MYAEMASSARAILDENDEILFWEARLKRGRAEMSRKGVTIIEGDGEPSDGVLLAVEKERISWLFGWA